MASAPVLHAAQQLQEHLALVTGVQVLIQTLSQTPADQHQILVGVSEGAGLSVLAASDESTHGVIAGVIALSLGDANELGWRWKDSLIYVTHGVPNEPTFSVVAIAGRDGVACEANELLAARDVLAGVDGYREPDRHHLATRQCAREPQ